MLVVYRAYDDNTADIMDITNYGVQFYYENALVALSKNQRVIGLSVSNNKINYLTPYSVISFACEDEAIEYIKENGLSYRNKIYANGMYYVLERTDKIIHVDYIIGYITEVESIYLADKGYTPYINSAKTFTKNEVFKVANKMRYSSKTGKLWKAIRVPVM